MESFVCLRSDCITRGVTGPKQADGLLEANDARFGIHATAHVLNEYFNDANGCKRARYSDVTVW